MSVAGHWGHGRHGRHGSARRARSTRSPRRTRRIFVIIAVVVIVAVIVRLAMSVILILFGFFFSGFSLLFERLGESFDLLLESGEFGLQFGHAPGASHVAIGNLDYARGYRRSSGNRHDDSAHCRGSRNGL
jgi:hypothetical protein